MGYETKIEAILSSENITDRLNTLNAYLSNNEENLTLDQYKRVRGLIENSYKKEVVEGIKNNVLDRGRVQKVGRKLTDYIRDEHMRLYLSQKNKKFGQKYEIKGEVPLLSFRETIEAENNLEYRENWYETDKVFYDLERMVIENNFDIDREKSLIESLPTKGLSKYKIRTLARIKPFLHFKEKLNGISNLISGRRKYAVIRQKIAR